MDFTFTARVRCWCQPGGLGPICSKTAEYTDIFNTLDETEREARERARVRFQKQGWYVGVLPVEARCPDHS